jgi:hypothetical protein
MSASQMSVLALEGPVQACFRALLEGLELAGIGRQLSTLSLRLVGHERVCRIDDMEM